jgi:predicted transcriptional regulator
MRMARGYLRWSVRDLSEASGVSGTTIKRMEETDGVPKSMADNVAAIQQAFEKAGIQRIPRNGGGPGVRLREPQGS